MIDPPIAREHDQGTWPEHRTTAAPSRRAIASSGRPGTRGPHMASLVPRRISQTFAGHDVAKPMHMPICMRNQ